MVDALGDFMAANNDNNIQDDVIRLVQEHGNLDEIRQQQQPNPQPPAAVPVPDDPVNAHEEWENVLPTELLDHPVILAFQESDANFLVSDPRIAGNPIIYASEVQYERALYRMLN